MAHSTSNTRKYMIDGVELPVYPEKIVPSHNLVSRSWNNMYAQFIDTPVNLKYKVNWIFPCITKAQANAIMSIINNKIENNKSRFFTINSAFPGHSTGFVTMNAYLGTPTTFESLDWMTDCGDVNYYKVELHWIETDGVVLI